MNCFLDCLIIVHTQGWIGNRVWIKRKRNIERVSMERKCKLEAYACKAMTQVDRTGGGPLLTKNARDDLTSQSSPVHTTVHTVQSCWHSAQWHACLRLSLFINVSFTRKCVQYSNSICTNNCYSFMILSLFAPFFITFPAAKVPLLLEIITLQHIRLWMREKEKGSEKKGSKQDRHRYGRVVSDKGELGEEVWELQYFDLFSFIARGSEWWKREEEESLCHRQNK